MGFCFTLLLGLRLPWLRVYNCTTFFFNGVPIWSIIQGAIVSIALNESYIVEDPNLEEIPIPDIQFIDE